MRYGATHRLGSLFDSETGQKEEGIWVDVFKLGKVYVPTQGDPKPIEITPEFVFQLEANFNLTHDIGDPPNLQKQHKDDGYQYGEIKAVRMESEWFQAFITFADPEDRERYNRRQIRKFSPGFTTNFMRTDTGIDIGPHLFELSFVSRAHQNNLRDPNDINPGVSLAHQDGGPPMAEEEATEEFNAQEAFSALAARFDAFEARFAEGDEDAPAEDEELAAKPEAVQMAARIAELEDKNVRLQLAAFDIDEERTTHLVALNRANPSLFLAAAKNLPKRKQDSIQPEIGSIGGGGAPVVTLAALVADGIKLGHDPKSAGFVGWAADNHMDRFDELVDAGRAHKTEG